MKLTELKRRVSLAVDAMKGAPLVYDYFVPKFKIETQPIQTIKARFVLYRPEADIVGPEAATAVAERELLEKLMQGLYQSGLVQVRKTNTPVSSIYEARILAVTPLEEE